MCAVDKKCDRERLNLCIGALRYDKREYNWCKANNVYTLENTEN